MTIGTSEAAITSVYIASASNGGPESQIPAGSTFYVTVKAEVGDSLWSLGPNGHIHAFLQNLTTLQMVPLASNPLAINAHSSFAAPETDQTFSFRVTVPASPVDTIYKPLAVMAIGAVDADVSVLEGNLTVVEQS